MTQLSETRPAPLAVACHALPMHTVFSVRRPWPSTPSLVCCALSPLPPLLPLQMNLNMDNCWGIVSGLSNLCNDLLETEGE